MSAATRRDNGGVAVERGVDISTHLNITPVHRRRHVSRTLVVDERAAVKVPDDLSNEEAATLSFDRAPAAFEKRGSDPGGRSPAVALSKDGDAA